MSYTQHRYVTHLSPQCAMCDVSSGASTTRLGHRFPPAETTEASGANFFATAP